LKLEVIVRRSIPFLIVSTLLPQCPLHFGETDARLAGSEDASAHDALVPDAEALDAAAIEECDGMDLGAPCGPVLSCDRFALGVLTDPSGLAVCFAHARHPIRGACDGAGKCAPPTASLCAGVPRGAPIVSCDADCLLGDQNCQEGAVADDVTLGSMCASSSTTTMCRGPVCVEDGQGFEARLDRRSCNALGRCVGQTDDCNNYRCALDGLSCLTSCSTDAECLTNVSCIHGFCQL
jgi:hypothetical protein